MRRIKRFFQILSHWRAHLANLKLQVIYRIFIIFECLVRIKEKGMNKALRGILNFRTLECYPYPFIKKYDVNSYEVGFEDGYPYVMHNGKKLFFQKGVQEKSVRFQYNQLLIEQDKESPHKYLLNKDRLPDADDVVADVGTAEGIFSLDIVESVKKIYMFECNPDWIEPLKRTFSPYKDKIEIVEKYIGGKDSDEMVTLDTFFKDKDITYIKADIEGYEEDMLRGGTQTYKGKIRKTLLCTYHLPDAEKIISSRLKEYGFSYKFNPNYCLFFYHMDDFKYPRVRRGVVFGYKEI